MTHRLRLALVPAYFALCLIFGGSSGSGMWANMVLQLIAIPLIIWALVAQRNTPLASSARRLLWLIAIALVLIGVQLIPLPPSLWTSLPGRESVVRGFEALGQPLPWMPISLAPAKTVASALWTLPALAILFGMLRLGAFRSAWLAYSLLAVTAVALAIGVLQLSQGPDSPLYFYRITNTNSSTGFFANTNNMGELMVVAIPFLAALYLSGTRKGGTVQKKSGLLLMVLGGLVVLLVGIAVNGSLAGVGLALPSLAASGLMLLFRGKRLPLWAGPAILALLAASTTVVLSSPFGNNLTTEDAQSSHISRYAAFTTTIKAIGDFSPVGSGIGTFPQIYPPYENPHQVDRWYMNHAHNDYLELTLEGGLPAAVLIGLFLLWWAWRVIQIWRAQEPDPFARAATIASAVTLAHSLVEFPLRTAAISAIFAVCCALMAEARPRVRRQPEADTTQAPQARHLSAD